LSKKGNRWFVSFCIDAERLPFEQTQESVGIDVGVKYAATLSNQQVFEGPKPLIASAKTKLARLQRQASKQVKGSNNQRKTYNKIGRIHARIACIRSYFLHKLTAYLAKTFKLIKIEDLKVKGMMTNYKLAGAISDLGFYEFKRQLDYTAVLKKVRYAHGGLCPMPTEAYALCPIVPHMRARKAISAKCMARSWC
jgi:putative transposase